MGAERGPGGGAWERPERAGEGPLRVWTQFNRAVVSASDKCSYLCFKDINEPQQRLRGKPFPSQAPAPCAFLAVTSLLAIAPGGARRGAGPRVSGGLGSRVYRARTSRLSPLLSAHRFRRGVKRMAQCLLCFLQTIRNAGAEDFSASDITLS